MVDALYAVKARKYDDWPFAQFADLDSAIKCVSSMHPEAESDELSGYIKRIPCFKSYSIVTKDDGLRCSEEVR